MSLDDPRKRALIDGLNEDLAHELGAVTTYLLFAEMVRGPHRASLARVFEAEIADELKHARFLAGKIVALGGLPTGEAKGVELSWDPRRMVEIVREAERQTIVRYERRIQQADALGEVGLRVVLEEFVADETSHMEEMDRILTGW